MNGLLVTLRLVHIGGGILWVGFAVFMVVILGPALERMGPDGSKVMPAIGPRLHTTIMPLIATLTLLSGFGLYWIMSDGLSSPYVHSVSGMTFGFGGLAALTAFLIGLILIKPAMTKAMALGQALGSAPTEQQAAIGSEARRHRDRALRGSKVATALLLVATACMAVARYL
jgi:hypothetical protein